MTPMSWAPIPMGPSGSRQRFGTLHPNPDFGRKDWAKPTPTPRLNPGLWEDHPKDHSDHCRHRGQAGSGLCPRAAPLTAVLLIRVISTVVNAVALSTDPQTYPVVLAAERSVGGTLEFHCTSKQKQTVTVKGDAVARLSHMSRAAARPLPALQGGLSHAGERAPEAEAKRLKQRQSPGCCEPSPHPVPAPKPPPHHQLLTLLSPSATPFLQLESPPAPQPHWPPLRGAARGPPRPSCPHSGAPAPGLSPHAGIWEGSGQRHRRVTHSTPRDFHPSCPHNRPPHHTSRPGACTGCCCTGTRPGDTCEL